MKSLILLICITILTAYCYTEEKPQMSTPMDPEYKEYWYNNEAEITSYQLEQARYGEIQEGQVAMVFVTEPFSRQSNTKADNPTSKDVPVMKLNMTKKFYTGVYPYSMMLSSFFPFEDGQNSVKLSCSVQEWCGHTFTTMKENKSDYTFGVDSYFEGESAAGVKTKKVLLEDDLWTKIRLMPDNLPTGSIQMIPSLFTIRLSHLETKVYDATASLEDKGGNAIYTVSYPELDRSLSITFEKAFPHKILGWEDNHYSGWGAKRKKLTTKASILKTIKSNYWSKHSVADSTLRKELMLK